MSGGGMGLSFYYFHYYLYNKINHQSLKFLKYVAVLDSIMKNLYKKKLSLERWSTRSTPETIHVN